MYLNLKTLKPKYEKQKPLYETFRRINSYNIFINIENKFIKMYNFFTIEISSRSQVQYFTFGPKITL